MIVPMKKVSLVVMDKDREIALERLRELGVVHPERRNVTSDVLAKLLERKARAETALGVLRSYTLPKGMEQSGEGDGEALVVRVLNLADERKILQEQLAWNVKEQSRIEKWGNFDPRLVKELGEQGIVLFLYELPLRTWEILSGGEARDHRVIILSRNKTSVFLLVPERELPGVSPFVLPEHSLAELARIRGEIQDRLGAIEKELGSLAARKGSIEAGQKVLLEGIDFETVRAGMEVAKDIPVDLTVSWISGFIPRDDLGLLKRAAAENNWALIAGDPGPDDVVPTKLKNNRLVSLIYPLTDFLETVPGYNEVDISGWFLLFFCIFFGMIFGDAGYGLLLMLIGIIGAVKSSKKGVPAGLKMLLLLSFSNLVWGVITCTWFGIDTAKLPAVLRLISIPPISNVTAALSAESKALVDQNLQIFCFSLALLQLGIAHIKGMARNIGSLKFFGELGSLAMLAGMFNVVLSLVVSNSYRRIPFLPLSLYLIAGGFLLAFVFAGYEGSIVKSIVSSLKNIISVVLGITNVFSDIMSYIRLWAVGLAGASISATVNTMAGPLLGNFLVFLGIILLVFGHSLNVILNVLSVLVHGVRLNTLEFSGHLGLTWSGTAYRPFSKTDKK
ncbi:MAG: V-type ATP synthase subunit I [Spirochaetaceae bacterium]|jgi:V/A-type H+-transporting ATPase subunit I|nr:V-type ATP synthase subunit I [Spirochaetaceae bacterium]